MPRPRDFKTTENAETLPTVPTAPMPLTPPSRPRRLFDLEHAREFLASVLGPDMHAARVESLANGVAGVLNAAVLSIHAIGQAYAALAEIQPKSAVKQVDRMLSNPGIVLSELLPLWATHVLGDAKEVVLAIDWTDFADDDHTTLCIYLVTSHGRAQPLCWETTEKSGLKDRRTALEMAMISRLARYLPAATRVTLLGDRGFGYVELYQLLERLEWDYVLRFRGNITVEDEAGEVDAADNWVYRNGRTRRLLQAKLTAQRVEVPAVVLREGIRNERGLVPGHEHSRRQSVGRGEVVQEAIHD